jgi:hypothetical protein
LANVTDKNISNWNLDNFSRSKHGKLVFVFDLVLKASELSLFAPVVE